MRSMHGEIFKLMTAVVQVYYFRYYCVLFRQWVRQSFFSLLVRQFVDPYSMKCACGVCSEATNKSQQTRNRLHYFTNRIAGLGNIYKSATAEAGSTQFVSEPLAFHAAGASLKVYIHINIYRGHLLARALHVSAEQRRGAVSFNFETNDLAVVSRDVAQHSHHLAEHSFFMCVSLALGDNHFRILGVLHTTQPFRSYNNCHSSDGCNCARALESCVCVCV